MIDAKEILRKAMACVPAESDQHYILRGAMRHATTVAIFVDVFNHRATPQEHRALSFLARIQAWRDLVW